MPLIEFITPIIFREDPEESKEFQRVIRSEKEKKSGGKEFTLVEQMKTREKIEKIRNMQNAILNTTYRGIKEELFYKSRIHRSTLEDMYQIQGAFWLPAQVPLSQRFKLSLSTRVNGVILKQVPYNVEYNLNKEEISKIEWSEPNEFKRKIIPQLLEYIPTDFHEQLEMLMDQTLSGNFEFGKRALCLRDLKDISSGYLFFMFTSSPQYKPLVHVFSTDSKYRRMIL